MSLPNRSKMQGIINNTVSGSRNAHSTHQDLRSKNPATICFIGFQRTIFQTAFSQDNQDWSLPFIV